MVGGADVAPGVAVQCSAAQPGLHLCPVTPDLQWQRPVLTSHPALTDPATQTLGTFHSALVLLTYRIAVAGVAARPASDVPVTLPTLHQDNT